MKKTILSIIVTVCWVSAAFAQPCLPDGITFTNQAQIDSFPINYPGCTEIEGGVTIHGHVSNIDNLNGLHVLNSIGGTLKICETSIINLIGLDSIVFIGGNLIIGQSDPPYTYEGNPLLQSLTGLENLTSIGGYLSITDNDALTSVSGLDNVASIGGYLEIYHTYLINLSGLENVISIGGDLRIGKVLSGVIPIAGNPSLTSVSGLDNLISVGGDLFIIGNSSLTGLSGLSNLTSIGGGITIWANELWNLNGFNNLTSINGSLIITVNQALASLSGLENVVSIENKLVIHGNSTLNSLTGLGEVLSIGGNLTIESNHYLSHCSVISICNYLSNPNGTVYIDDNTTGCNSQDEVLEACVSSINDLNLTNNLLISPNPSNSEITISGVDGNINEIGIYNKLGQRVSHEQNPGKTIDVSWLHHGLYIVEVVLDGHRVRKKLIVQ